MTTARHGSARDRLAQALDTTAGWIRLSLRTAIYAGTSSTVGAVTPGPHLSQWLFARWCRATVRQLGVTLDAAGLEAARDAAPCILAANHLSALDIPVLGAVLEGDYRWVAKRELFRVPFVGWHLWSAGHIPVDRRAGRKAAVSLQARVERVLAEGASVLLFPEGTRSADGALQRFKLGAFQAAVRAGVPLVPIVLDGTQAIVRKGAFTLDPSAPRTVVVRGLAPVPYDQGLARTRPDEAAKALRDATFARFVEVLDALRGAQGAALAPYPPPGNAQSSQVAAPTRAR